MTMILDRANKWWVTVGKYAVCVFWLFALLIVNTVNILFIYMFCFSDE